MSFPGCDLVVELEVVLNWWMVPYRMRQCPSLGQDMLPENGSARAEDGMQEPLQGWAF